MKHTPEQLEDLAELFRVLGHPMRLAVLFTLAEREMSVGDLAERAEIGMSMLSQQLAVLRRAELVATRREGKQVFYSLSAARMGHLRDALGELRDTDPAGEQALPGWEQAQTSAAMFARIRPVTQ